MTITEEMIDQMSSKKLRTTLKKVERERCYAWTKYYNLLKEFKALKNLHPPSEGETDTASTSEKDEESESETDDDEDEPLINLVQNRATTPSTPEPVFDKNGKPKKWCELCQKHISRDNFATHIKTAKKHQTN